jgi:hypothetical protein
MFSFLKKIFAKKEEKYFDDSYLDAPSKYYGMTYREFDKYIKNIDYLDVNTIHKEDYGSLSASALMRAKKAIKEKRFDDAWGLLHQAKISGVEHCKSQPNNCSRMQLIYYETRPHAAMANILRMEKKHTQALIDYTYFVTDSENLTVKYKRKKLRAYFNRAKLSNITLDEYKDFIFSMNGEPDYFKIETFVKTRDINF